MNQRPLHPKKVSDSNYKGNKFYWKDYVLQNIVENIYKIIKYLDKLFFIFPFIIIFIGIFNVGRICNILQHLLVLDLGKGHQF